MFGVFFIYNNRNQEHLIECFPSEQEAMNAKSKYIVGPGDKVVVKSLT